MPCGGLAARTAGHLGDLLAEVAGIFEEKSEGKLDEPLVRQASGPVPHSRY